MRGELNCYGCSSVLQPFAPSTADYQPYIFHRIAFPFDTCLEKLHYKKMDVYLDAIDNTKFSQHSIFSTCRNSVATF